MVYSDNSHLQEAPDGHCSTFAMSPARCVHNNTASIQLYCCGSAGHDRTCNDGGHLPLGGSRRRYRTVQRFFSQALPWAMLFWMFFRQHVYRSDEVLLAGRATKS